MSHVHGTYAAYATGCRCTRCAEYQRARVAANRASRKADIKTHGNRSSYDAGCRCAPCSAARSEAYRRLEATS